MARIQTFVFIDLETTGMPASEGNRTKITEMSMIAVKRQHALDARPGTAPRVQQKVTLCFNPGRLIQPGATEVTGLCNDLLEYEPYFDEQTFNIMDTFLNILTKPVCLIAHNGFEFDYPILKAQLKKLKVQFTEDLLCADCFHGFYNVENKKEQSGESCQAVNGNSSDNVNSSGPTDLESDIILIKINNETTPKQKTVKFCPTTPTKVCQSSKTVNKARRRFPWSAGEKPKHSYKLRHVYDRLLNKPAPEAHRAENDCILALECFVAVSKPFVEWADKNHKLFSDVKPMTVGVPLGS